MPWSTIDIGCDGREKTRQEALQDFRRTNRASESDLSRTVVSHVSRRAAISRRRSCYWGYDLCRGGGSAMLSSLTYFGFHAFFLLSSSTKKLLNRTRSPAEWTLIACFRSPNTQDTNGQLDTLWPNPPTAPPNVIFPVRNISVLIPCRLLRLPREIWIFLLRTASQDLLLLLPQRLNRGERAFVGLSQFALQIRARVQG
ncbi:hypothetical protein GOODEAATRI_001152 [Goodea atripinnis]|uniref:Uncharacterized protein n=1 Tax=Goodea atripinnis TaxID=208336 RepID=A0ABV0PK13_9TELE